MQSKQNLIDYMVSGTIHLGKKDYSFFYNLKKQIMQNQFITSAQAKLFDKLIYKYSRQLKKYGNEPDKLIGLSWDIEIKETLVEYTQAYISISENTIIIKSPFNKNFLSELRKKCFDTFVWDKATKTHRAVFTTSSFRNAIQITKEHYTTNYDDQVTELLDYLGQYENCIWNPTLVCKNGNLYVVACNEALYNYLPAKLDLNNETVMRLTNLGVKFENGLLSQEHAFFCTYVSKISFDDIKIVFKLLKDANIKTVVLGKVYQRWVLQLKDTLKSLNIDYIDTSEKNITLPREDYVLITSSTTYNYNDQWDHFKVPTKIILVQNSNPITIL